MVARILGIQDISFTNAQGEKIVGTSLYVAFPEEHIRGMRTEKMFLKDSISLPKDLQPNDTVDLAFNYKGKVEAVYKVTK